MHCISSAYVQSDVRSRASLSHDYGIVSPDAIENGNHGSLGSAEEVRVMNSPFGASPYGTISMDGLVNS